MGPRPRDQELRLAVVMSGGVSLSIWMGGVSAEVDRLRRQDGAYGELLALLGQDPIVDIVSGTSAGGLNGVLLATAVANGSKADTIRGVWEKRADFKDLLRPVNDADPRSLLRGDEYFLVQLNEALHDVRAAGDGGASLPSESQTEPVPLRLFVTVSLVASRSRRYVDSSGDPIGEIDHRGTMEFDLDALRSPEKVSALALAARSSASFPIAFEPSWIPVRGIDSPASDVDLAHPDMSDHAWWNGSGYVLDGGLVLNRPLRPALQAIAEQRADRAVRRLIVFVDPNPNTTFDDAHEKHDIPGLLGVGKAMVDITSKQSIADDLEELRRHNEQVTLQRGLRRALTPLNPKELEAAAAPFRETYAKQRGSIWARDLMDDLSAHRVLVEERRLDDVSSALEQRLAAERTIDIRAALVGLLTPASAPTAPAATEPETQLATATATATAGELDRQSDLEIRHAFASGLDAADMELPQLFEPDWVSRAARRAASSGLVARVNIGELSLDEAADQIAEQTLEQYLRNLPHEMRTARINSPGYVRAARAAAAEIVRKMSAELAAIIDAALAPAPEWKFDTAPLERAARDALWVMHTVLNLKPGTDDANTVLRESRKKVWGILGELTEFQQRETDYWADALKPLTPTEQADKVHLLYTEFPAKYALDYGKTPTQFYAELAAQLATAVHAGFARVRELTKDSIRNGRLIHAASGEEAETYEEIDAEITAVIGAANVTATYVPDLRDVAYERRAVLLDIARSPMLATAVPSDEALELLHLSAYADNAFDGRDRPDSKLTGLQLNHFGAFYRSSWRGNDWLWGRLDAVHHLVRALLEPARLQRLYLEDPDAPDVPDAPETPEGDENDDAADVSIPPTPAVKKPDDRATLRAAITAAATGLSAESVAIVLAETDPTKRHALAAAHAGSDADVVFLVADLNARLAAVDDELKIVVPENGQLDTTKLRSVLPATSAWVTRRLQLGILREELPKLAGDARTDVAAGAENSLSLQAFIEKAKVFGTVRAATPAEIAELGAATAAGVNVVDAPRQATPEEVVGAFTACEIGSERLGGEVHSQLFAQISSQSAAVALNAISGKSGFTPLRPVLGGARGLSKALFRITQAVRERQPISIALVGLVSLLAAAVIAVSIATGGRLANPIVAIAIPFVAALAIAALLRDRSGIAVAASFAIVIVGWLAGIVWASSLTGVVQVTLALVGTLFLLSIIYGITESRRTAVVVISVLVWLAAIVMGGIYFENTVHWSHVATAADCHRATSTVITPTLHSPPTAHSKPVLCIRGDRAMAARALAGLTGLVLFLAGAALFLRWITRKLNEQRAKEAKVVATLSGVGVAWFSHLVFSRNGAFVDDHGRVAAWERDNAVFNSDGVPCGWIRDGIVRDRDGKVVAFVDGAKLTNPPLPTLKRPVRRPPPTPRPHRPAFQDLPSRPHDVAEASPTSWTTLLRTPLPPA